MNARRISARNEENGKISAQGRITKRDFVINQILEKNLFSFFPFSPCSLEKDLWRGRMCHPTWKEKIPVTRVRSRHSHRLCVERIFFLNFKTDISSTVTNVYKLSISIVATSTKKKKKIIHSLVKRIVSSLLDVSPYGCNSFIFRLIKYKI